jgi:tetratricopeptide (TPR) repeat protein/2-polyprenyl-3-methyl-5-hydroxy-6-metoxy-1,4-benzoquinol methylase
MNRLRGGLRHHHCWWPEQITPLLGKDRLVLDSYPNPTNFIMTSAGNTPDISSKNTIELLLADAFKKMQARQLQQADVLCQTILTQHPAQADAWHLRGLIAHQLGDNKAAIEFVQQATRAAPTQPVFHYNLGGLLKDQGQLELAASSYERALSLAPDAETLCNLGIVLRALGRLEESIDSYRRALKLRPNFAEVLNNLGNALIELNRLPEALDSLKQALLARPQYPEALNSLGVVYRKLRQLDAAAVCFRQALSLRPSFADAATNLAGTLHNSGQFNEALQYYCQSLRLSNSRQAQIGFAHCVKYAELSSVDAELQQFVIRAIDEAWIRPAELWIPACSLVRLDRAVDDCIRRASTAWPDHMAEIRLFGPGELQVVMRNPILRCLLRNIPVMDLDVERFLVVCRGVLLKHAMTESGGEKLSQDSDLADSEALDFFSALAAQCFINEYVFALTETDSVQVELLRGILTSQLQTGAPVSALGLIAFAAYSPLTSLGMTECLVGQVWPDPVARLVKQQLHESAEERSYALNMRQVTPLAEGVSTAVRSLYEQNPYPRWIHASREIPFSSVDAFLMKLFPDAGLVRPARSVDIQVLVAGCGTGQHPIQTATTFPFAKILAVDLSVASLSYAKRKTEELALTNIDFAQADILNISALQQTFDIIESVGVLHHLAEPLAGWRALVALLKPNGLMRLGFYSELARQTIVSARNCISLQGYSPDARGIRQCRQDLMSPENIGEFGQLQFAGDFFTVSGCRDLLFHIQEHRFSLVQIKAALEELGLTLIGFTLDDSVKNQYRKQFPDDLAMVDLDNWHKFECDHPDTFANMYQFWAQRIS